jgi:4-hydroxybenzoate polyprenyltransferase
MARLLTLTSSFVESIFKLTRFGNLVIIGFAQYFTAGFLVDKSTIYDFRLFLLTLSTVSIAAAGYVINDYYDVKIDYINKPDRVVVGRSIARRYAILLHVFLSTLGILIGVYLSWEIAAVNVAAVFLLWLYSNLLKRLPFIGNLSVALLTGSSIFTVDILYRTTSAVVVSYAVFAFFMTLVREIIKDMEDLRGDNTFGCKTLPIVLGIRKTKLIIYSLVVIFLTAVVALDLVIRTLPFQFYLIFLYLPLLVMVGWLVRADTKHDFTQLSTLCKVIMLLGILSMMFV